MAYIPKIIGFLLALSISFCRPVYKRNIYRDPSELSEMEIKRMADSFYDNDKYDSAIKYFTFLIHSDSTQGEYYFKRGYSFGMISKKRKAIADFEKSIVLKYRVSDSYLNIAADTLLENDSMALFYFEKSYEADSQNVKAAHEIRFLKEYRRRKKRNDN